MSLLSASLLAKGDRMDDLQQLPDEDLWSRLADTQGRDRLEILFELGGRASRRGDYDRAMTLWQEAEAVAEGLDDFGMVAEALRLQGAAAFFAAEYGAAIGLYGKAAQGYEQVGQTRQQPARYGAWRTLSGRSGTPRISWWPPARAGNWPSTSRSTVSPAMPAKCRPEPCSS